MQYCSFMAEEHKTEKRVIAHFDIDCFYAQSEELRCPSLRGRAIGVTQKFLVVTSNYVARGLGVPKMVSIAEAKRKLPTLVLVNGEDLTPYRADSKRIMAVLRRFGTVERYGLDEGAVDITAQVEARLQSGPPTLSFSGHVLGVGSPLRTGNGPQSDTFFNFESMQLNLDIFPLVDVSLLVGSQVVADMRTAIEKETGFRCSCGVAQNKMLAKLSSSLNKPSMQTCLLQGAVAEFLAPMSVRRIPGVGQQINGVLSGMNVETISDLGKVPLKQLCERLGDRIAVFLFNAARGQDPSPVQDKGPPKSISVEDSFRNCLTMQHAVERLRVLAPDLIRRLDEDREETGRRPKSFTVKWRVQGPKWNFISVSTQMPQDLVLPSTTVEKRAFLAVDVATKLLSRSLQEPFNLAVLNIGATNFESASTSPCICDIRSFLQGKRKSPDKELKIISKRDARANRESFKAMAKKSRDVPSVVQFQDEYHLSNSSEDEEVDDLADQLKLSGRRSSLQRDNRQMDIQARTSQFLQQEFSEEEETKLSNRLATSGMDGCSGLHVSPRKVEKATSCREANGANPAIVNSPMKQSCSPSKGANQVPLCSLLKRHHDADGAVPLSRNLFAVHPPAAVPVEQGGTFVNSRQDMKDLMSTKSGNNSTSIDISESKLNLFTKPVEMSIRETSSRSNHPGSCTEGYGSEHVEACECGEMVEDTDSGRQEHADYHFALILDKLERNSLPESPESSSILSTAKRARVVHSAPPLKNSKSRNGTLDGFVVRRP